MEIAVHHDNKMVEVWLTKTEQADCALQSRLKSLYSTYKSKKYLVAVFQSGKAELADCTAGLIVHNQTVAAQHDLAKMREAVSY